MKNSIKSCFKKNMRNIVNRSLIEQLITMYIMIIGIPILIFSLYMFNSLLKNAKNDAIDRASYDLSTEYDSIEKNVYIMRNIINSIESDNEVLGYLQGYEDQEQKRLINFRETTYKQLIKMQNNNPAIKEINIFTSNMKINEIWPTFYRIDRIIDNDWYIKTIKKNGNEYWNFNNYDNDILTKSEPNNEGKDLVVSLNKKINHYSNNYLGIIRVTMRSQDFFPKMFEDDDLKAGQILLINTENMDIKTDESNSLLRKFNFDEKKFKKFIVGNLQNEKGKITYKQGKEEYIILFKESPIANNYLISVIPVNNISQEMKDSRKVVISGAFSLLIILSIIIYFATKAILKRLYKIIHAVKQVRAGDLMPSIEVYGNDEVGVLAHNFRQMMRTIDTLIKESANKEKLTKEAELKALKTQIDAHFLYNTLENIRMMALIEENYMVSDCLSSLGNMMRYNMKWNSEFVSLKQEINHIKNYVALMNLRYDFEIILNIDIEDKFLDREILKLIVQPLVENAVKHGLSEKLRRENGTIIISIEEDNMQLYLNVKDNGNGINIEKLQELNNYINGCEDKTYGLGLKNVNDRIKLFYGNHYGVIIESQEYSYTKVTIKLPNIKKMHKLD